MEDREVVVN